MHYISLGYFALSLLNLKDLGYALNLPLLIGLFLTVKGFLLL